MINKEKFGYVFASKMLFEDNRRVMYFYHEQPDLPTDSGWRFFCGEETQEYCDNPDNIAIYSITSVLNVSPDIEKYLDTDKIIAFERNPKTNVFKEVKFEVKNMLDEKSRLTNDEIFNRKDIKLLPGATKEQIKNFETNNGVNLPEDYKGWLEKCDGGDLYLPAGVQFYGVAHKPIIDVNSNDVPEEYVMIGCLSTGDPVMFKQNTQSICIYNQECRCIEPDEVYENFSQFLDALKTEILGINEG